MKSRHSQIALPTLLVILLAGFVGFVVSTSADSSLINFETYSTGSINGQDGWSSTGPYDQAVVSNAGALYSYPAFGNQSLRLSNAVTSGSFGDQTFSKSLTDEAGETAATNAGLSGGTRQQHFEAQFDIASTMPEPQSGMSVSVSPDRGDGSRQSYLRFVDGVDGIDVFFDDVQGVGPVDFVETQVAVGLSRTVSHTIRFAMDFYDGPSNDVVKIYIDDNLVHIGTSWENYYWFDPEAAAEQNPRTVDSLIFRAGGTPVPANAGNGFLFDNVSLSSGPFGAPTVSTVLITHANLSTDGANNNRWFLYNDFNDTIDNTLGTFVTGPGTPPLGLGSAQVSVSGATTRSSLATYQFGGNTLGDITRLKFSTYNPSATNFQGPNSSAYLNFNIDFNPGLPVPIVGYQGRIVFIPKLNGAIVPDSWNAWDAINGGNALWLYPNRIWPTPVTGPHAGMAGVSGSTTPRTWNDLLADYPGIRVSPTNPWMGLRVGEPYPLGYTENMDKFVFGTASAVTSFDFDPDQVEVHVLKYLDGAMATAASAQSASFPMLASWDAANLGAGSGNYPLGPSGFNAGAPYEATTAPMTQGASYSTSEVIDGLVVGSCSSGAPYELVGYTSGDTLADAQALTPGPSSPAFVGLLGNKTVIVWNKTCPPLSTITASPSLIQVCDGTGQGITTLTWAARAGVTATQVRVGSVTGPLFTAIGPSGHKDTGKWVTEGLVFYLQDVSGGLPLTAANTLATVTGHVTSDGCHTAAGTIVVAPPNPIQVCDGSGLGTATLTWTTTNVTAMQIHLNSPSGPLFTAIGTSGSKATGKWVTEGLVFYLQDVSGGLPLTAANTLATTTAHVTTAGCNTGSGTITANPNPIQVCDGSGMGATTLTWTTTGASATQVHVGSPTGPLFSSIGPNGTKATGAWVLDGMTFYLQNVSGGLPLTGANTLATVAVSVVPTATCP